MMRSIASTPESTPSRTSPYSPIHSKQVSSSLLPFSSPLLSGIDVLNNVYWSLQWGIEDAKILKTQPRNNSFTFNTSISSFNSPHEPGRDITEAEWCAIVNDDHQTWTATCVFDWPVYDDDDDNNDGKKSQSQDFPHGGPIIFDGLSTVRDVLNAISHLRHPFGWFEGIKKTSSGQWLLKFGP
jgi:hypothetical protein